MLDRILSISQLLEPPSDHSRMSTSLADNLPFQRLTYEDAVVCLFAADFTGNDTCFH